MTRLPVTIALLLGSAGAWAQGLPVGVASQPAVAAPPPPAEAKSPAQPRPRSVRYAQQSVRMVIGTSPESLKLDPARYPVAGR